MPFDYLAGAIPLTAMLTFLMVKKDSRNDLERMLAKYACEAETNKPSINIVTSEISKSGHDPSLTVLNSDESTQTTTDQTASEFHRVYTSREVVPYISLHPLGSGTFGWVDKVESTAAPSLGQDPVVQLEHACGTGSHCQRSEDPEAPAPRTHC